MTLNECVNKNIPYIGDADITTTGHLDLRGYAHPLPSGITTTGYLYLSGYAHPLPAGIAHKESRQELKK